MIRKKIKYFGIGLIAILLVASAFLLINQVKAATIDFFVDSLSALNTSAASDHDIVFGAVSSVDAGETITITFPADFDTSTIVFGDIDVIDNGSQLTLAAAPSGATWGAVMAADVLTLTSGTGTIAAGDTVEVLIGTNTTQGGVGTHQIVNPATAGPYTLSIAGTFGDTGTSGNIDITGPGSVGVTGSVVNSMTFSLGSYSINFGQLSTSLTKTTSHNLTMATNGAGGIVVVVTGNTLRKTTDITKTIDPCNTATYKCTPTIGTKQFGLNLVANTGFGANPSCITDCAAPVVNYDTTDKFSFKTGDTVASNGGPTLTTVMRASYIANISSLTPAGTYTTTLTYTATCTF